jgi:hypothetical protein
VVPQAVQRDVLLVLVAFDGNRALWSLDDLARATEGVEIAESVEVLRRAGLVYRTPDGLVFASPAAVHCVELLGHVV